jgi:uncharacterized protein YktA (UPF0223 family)
MMSQKQIISLLFCLGAGVGPAFSWLLEKARDIVEQYKKFKDSHPSKSDNKTEAGIHSESDNKSNLKKT